MTTPDTAPASSPLVFDPRRRVGHIGTAADPAVVVSAGDGSRRAMVYHSARPDAESAVLTVARLRARGWTVVPAATTVTALRNFAGSGVNPKAVFSAAWAIVTGRKPSYGGSGHPTVK